MNDDRPLINNPSLFLRGCVVIFLLASIIGSAGYRALRRHRFPNEQVDRQMDSLANEEVDRQMDALASELNQQLDQFPRFEAPARDRLSRDESQAKLKDVSRLAERGELDEAAEQLAAADLDLPEAWMLPGARAIVEALRQHRDDVTPLAARATAAVLQYLPDGGAARTPPLVTGFALLDEGRVVAAAIRDDLRSRLAWAWKFEGPTELKPVYLVQGYRNVNVADDLTHTRRRLEHYHFAVFIVDLSARHGDAGEQCRQYLRSYVLLSKELYGGERIYFLEDVLAGARDILEVYDTPPSYALVEQAVRKKLKEAK